MEFSEETLNILLSQLKTTTKNNNPEIIFKRNSSLFSKILKAEKNNFMDSQTRSKIINEFLKLTFSLFQNMQNKQIFSDLILLINNVFNLSPHHLDFSIFNEKTILNNLSKYFIEFCKRFQEESLEHHSKKTHLYFEFYSIIYFLTMLVCQRDQKQSQVNLQQTLFTNSFLTNFLTLEITFCAKYPQIFKLISIILVFLVKKLNLLEWHSKIKTFILYHFDKITDKKSEFNLTYCMRTLTIARFHFTHAEIKKYQIIPFLINSLDSPLHDYHILYTIDLIRLIVRKYPITVQTFLHLNLLEKLVINFHNQSSLIVSLLEQLCQYIPTSTKSLLSSHFEKQFFLPNTNQSQIYILKCITLFIRSKTPNQLIQSFQHGILDKATEVMKRYPQSFKNIHIGFHFYETILEYLYKQKHPILPHVISKIDCLGIVQMAQNSHQLFLLKQIISNFKAKLQYFSL